LFRCVDISLYCMCHDLEFVSYFEVLVSSVSLWLAALVLIVSFCVIAGSALIVFTCVSFPVVQSPPPACVVNPVRLIPSVASYRLGRILSSWLVCEIKYWFCRSCVGIWVLSLSLRHPWHLLTICYWVRVNEDGTKRKYKKFWSQLKKSTTNLYLLCFCTDDKRNVMKRSLAPRHDESVANETIPCVWKGPIHV